MRKGSVLFLPSLTTSTPFRLVATTRRVSVRMASFRLAARNPAARHDRPTSASQPVLRRAPAPLWLRACAREVGVSRRLPRFGGLSACWGAFSTPSGLPAMSVNRASDTPSSRALRAGVLFGTCSPITRGLDDCHFRSVKIKSFHRPRCLPSKGIESLSPTWFPTKEYRFDPSSISRLCRRDSTLDASSRRCLPSALRQLRHRARPLFTTHSRG